jgi:hypothetical protein
MCSTSSPHAYKAVEGGRTGERARSRSPQVPTGAWGASKNAYAAFYANEVGSEGCPQVNALKLLTIQSTRALLNVGVDAPWYSHESLDDIQESTEVNGPF